ncbi:proteasome activator complex subunit 2, partial [Mustelus asterias]
MLGGVCGFTLSHPLSLPPQAGHLISTQMPNKISELDKLLQQDFLNLKDLTQIHGELDIPIPEPPKKEEENGEKTSETEDEKEKKEKPPKCGPQKANDKIQKLLQHVKPELRLLKETCITLTTWIQYMVPKIEDGNDFGVAIQEKILERTAAVKTKVEGFQTSITKYFTERGDAVAKASKDRHV